jgi:hypothetical protein
MLGSNDATPLHNLQTGRRRTLSAELQSRVRNMRAQKEGLSVRLWEVGFYASGSTAIHICSKRAIAWPWCHLRAPKTSELLWDTDNVPMHLRISNSLAKLFTSRLARWVKLFLCNCQIDLARPRVSGFAKFRLDGDAAARNSRSNDRRIDNLIPWPVLGKQWPMGKSASAENSSSVVSPGSPAAPRAITLPQGP